ncbi:hypothetical protein [Amycolatopsis minnesotensis]|uniref:Uncharacterized protein n=1 Tax=Amycolatopsis minnesotensis TaxID=337894 RepID=A0ABN2QWE4_9PSEU
MRHRLSGTGQAGVAEHEEVAAGYGLPIGLTFVLDGAALVPAVPEDLVAEALPAMPVS